MWLQVLGHWAHHKALRIGHGLEHWFFVAYSAFEVIGLHHTIYYVSLALLVTGVMGLVYEWFALE